MQAKTSIRINFWRNLKTHTGICTLMCLNVCGCVHAHECEGQRKALGSSSGHHAPPLRQGLTLYPDQTGWPGRTKSPPLSASPVLGLQTWPIMPGCWTEVLGTELRSSCEPHKHVLTELLSPILFLLLGTNLFHFFFNFPRNKVIQKPLFSMDYGLWIQFLFNNSIHQMGKGIRK